MKIAIDHKAGMAAVNAVNKQSTSHKAQQIPSLSPLHDTFRTGPSHRGFKRSWCTK